VGAKLRGFYISGSVVRRLHVAHILRPRLLYAFFPERPLPIYTTSQFTPLMFGLVPLADCSLLRSPLYTSLFFMEIPFLIYAFFIDTRFLRGTNRA